MTRHISPAALAEAPVLKDEGVRIDRYRFVILCRFL
jgi:hypothetical protein